MANKQALKFFNFQITRELHQRLLDYVIVIQGMHPERTVTLSEVIRGFILTGLGDFVAASPRSPEKAGEPIAPSVQEEAMAFDPEALVASSV